MGTYLANEKMSPALRKRIEASVRRSSRIAKPGLPIFVKTALRLSLIIVVLGGGAWLYVAWRQHLSQVEAARASLLQDVQENVIALDEADLRLRTNAQALLLSASMTYEGDYVSPSLDEPDVVSELLARPVLYVRGPIEAFQRTSKFERAIAEPVDDAFVHCLVDPPEERSELPLLRRIEAPRDMTRFFHLAEAFTIRPFASDAWSSQVHAAATLTEINRLRDSVKLARMDRAVLAVRAEILIHILDEPRTAGTFAEVDGASDHQVRVGIIDLTADATLLRLRRHVEPSWISEANRPYFARSLVACRLAADVREVLEEGL